MHKSTWSAILSLNAYLRRVLFLHLSALLIKWLHISADLLSMILLTCSVFVHAMWRVFAPVTWICGGKLNPVQLDKLRDVIGGS